MTKIDNKTVKASVKKQSKAPGHADGGWSINVIKKKNGEKVGGNVRERKSEDESDLRPLARPGSHRPISRMEAVERSNRVLERLRLGDVWAYHRRCRHAYRTRAGGRKEAQILEGGPCGGCSVCWKLKKLDMEKRARAEELVYDFYQTQTQGDEHARATTAAKYYKWLYSR